MFSNYHLPFGLAKGFLFLRSWKNREEAGKEGGKPFPLVNPYAGLKAPSRKDFHN